MEKSESSDSESKTEPAESETKTESTDTESKPKAGDAAKTAKAANPEAALKLPVGRNFRQAPFQEVMDYFTTETGVKFQLDMKSLFLDQGVTRNMPITLESEKMTIQEFLDEIAVKKVKAVYLLEPDRVVIVSRKAAKGAAPGSKREP